MHEIAYPIITPDDKFKTESEPDLTGLVEILTTAMMNAVVLFRKNIHYILSAVLLNPVLFLHGLNALLTATQERLDLPYLVSSFVEPHVDINNNHKHAMFYTLFITYAQWKASQRCLAISSEQKVLAEKQGASEEDQDDYWQENEEQSK